MIFRNTLYAAAFAVFLLLCGCGAGERGEPAETSPSVSSGQVYPVGSYERRAAEFAASGADISGRELTDFGEESVFGGIQVESDENGELLCTESEGALWFRITDGRFHSCGELTAFVKKHSGVREAERLRGLFRERDGGLYFVIGADGHGVKSSRRYVFCHPPRLTVQAVHSEDCRRKYGLSRSHICFSREDGVWKLCSLTTVIQ